VRATLITFAILLIGFVSCNRPSRKSKDSLQNTIYKLGFKADSSSIGSLENSAFVLKLNDSLPALMLTAHHVVAGTASGEYLSWSELDTQKNDWWGWSMNDSTYEFKIGSTLPIRGAETLKLDLSVFYLLTDSVPYLKPASQDAKTGDTVYLYSKIKYNNKTTLKNAGLVIYATDSVFVYELNDFISNVVGIMTGTSGSCVINKDNEVIGNSFGGLTIPNEKIKRQMAVGFPLIDKLEIRDGRAYGIGVPISLIRKSVVNALKAKK